MFGRKKNTALYYFYNRANELIYIGISYEPMKRLKQHERTKVWSREIKKVMIWQYSTRKEALEAEEVAIKKDKPKYNKQHSTTYKRTTKNSLVIVLDILREFLKGRR